MVVVPCVCVVIPQRICNRVVLPVVRVGEAAAQLDDADALAFADSEAYVAEHPVLLVELLPTTEQRLFQLIVAVHVELEGLPDALAADNRLGHDGAR